MIVLSVSGDSVRRFMLAAHDLGYTNGEYVFLDVELFPFKGETQPQVYDLPCKHMSVAIGGLYRKGYIIVMLGMTRTYYVEESAG